MNRLDVLQSHDQPMKKDKKKKQGRSVGEKLKNGERGEGRVSNIGGLHKTVEELATFC